MLWSVCPSTQNLPPGFTCLYSKSAQLSECVQFRPAQTQKCCSGLTLTPLFSALEQRGCCHHFCSAKPHLVLCFHVFCLFGHISYLQTHFLLIPSGILLIWVWTHTPVHTSVGFFPMYFYMCDCMFVFPLQLFPSCCTEKLQTFQFLLTHSSSYDYIHASLVITADTSISDHNFCGQPASHSLAGKEK